MATAIAPAPSTAQLATHAGSPPRLITIEEFANRPDPGHPEELVEGRIVTMPPPKPRHGQVCFRVARIIDEHAALHELGQILTNDSGVITSRDPDTLRGADVLFYSYDKVSKGPIPPGYLNVLPDLVVEVPSPDDEQADILRKVAEYLAAGVGAVGVLDPERRILDLYEGPTSRRLGEDDLFELPAILGELSVPVHRFLD